MVGQALVSGNPFPGVNHFFHFMERNSALEQGQHPGKKWNAQVHFRETEISPVRPHETKIEGAAQNGAAGEGCGPIWPQWWAWDKEAAF